MSTGHASIWITMAWLLCVVKDKGDLVPSLSRTKNVNKSGLSSFTSDQPIALTSYRPAMGDGWAAREPPHGGEAVSSSRVAVQEQVPSEATKLTWVFTHI